MSPQLGWRGPDYVIAGFAGIVALGLALVQPLLIGGYLPGLQAYRGRRAHHWIGGALVVAIVIHVAGLWITSPPDMIDALTFIEHLKTHPYRDTTVGRHVVVIGAGNTAIDAVTQAKRLGAASSTIAPRT